MTKKSVPVPVRVVFTINSLWNKFCKHTTHVFLNLEAAFNSVGRSILWPCFSLEGEWEKFVLLTQSPYVNNRGWVRAYGDFSPKFTTRSVACHCCAFSTQLYLRDDYKDRSVFVWEQWGWYLPRQELLDLEYPNHVMELSEDPDRLQTFLERLNDIAFMFGIHFESTKHKILFQE